MKSTSNKIDYEKLETSEREEKTKLKAFEIEWFFQ